MIGYGSQPVFYYMNHMAGSINAFANSVFGKLESLGAVDGNGIDVTDYDNVRRLLSFVQPYDYHENDYSDKPNYYQREWRVVFEDIRAVESLDHIKPGQQYLDKQNDCVFLCFDYSDIESIIVPEILKVEAGSLIQGKGSIRLHSYEDFVGVS